jgi:hypothetical protein
MRQAIVDRRRYRLIEVVETAKGRLGATAGVVIVRISASAHG